MSANPFKLLLSAPLKIATSPQRRAPILLLITTMLVTSCAGIGASPQNSESGPVRKWTDVLGAEKNSPGVNATVKETGRIRKEKYTEVTYRLIADGAPEDKTYDIYFYDLGKFSSNGGVAGPIPGVNPNGFNLHFHKMMRGEWVEVGFISQDKSVKGFVHFAPFPIEAFDKSCHVWLELIVPGRVFSVDGEGFVPGESVTTISTSGREKLSGELVVAEDGKLPVSIVIAGNVWKQYDANYTVEGRDCRVSVDYQWGRPSTEWQ